jgi:putative transposase
LKLLERRTSTRGSCPCADINSTEVLSCTGGWLYKGESAIHIARTYLGQKKNYGGMSFWARGYFVTTVGTDEEVVRTYIREPEKRR